MNFMNEIAHEPCWLCAPNRAAGRAASYGSLQTGSKRLTSEALVNNRTHILHKTYFSGVRLTKMLSVGIALNTYLLNYFSNVNVMT